MKKDQWGFTLIEVMIVVVVVGILAAIAIPSYQSFIIKSNRRAAQAFMSDVANKERQFLLDSRSYTDSLTTLGMPPPSDISKNYTVSVTAPTTAPPSFTITATPIATSMQSTDGELTLTDTGLKTPVDKW